MLNGRRCVGALGLLLSCASSSGAQESQRSAPQLVPAIDPAELRRHIEAITHDSMGGRNTPSVGLERTARYVVGQFQALGLKPAGDPIYSACALREGAGVEVPWLHRYPVPGTLRAVGGMVSFSVRLLHAGTSVVDEQGRLAKRVTYVSFGSLARFAVDTVPQSGGIDITTLAEVRVLTGRHTPASAARAVARDGVVLYVPSPGDTATERQVIGQLVRTSYVVVLAAEDSATFAARRASAAEHPPVVLDWMFEGGGATPHWAAYVWPGALADILAAAGLGLAALGADTVPRVRTAPAISIGFMPDAERAPQDTATAVNAAAILPGTDTALRNQYVVISAHMDHAGLRRGQPDSLAGGPDDNVSGVAGLLALAKAFSQPGARPKRPLLFLATSGGAKDKNHWGAHAYAAPEHVDFVYALTLTLDMLDRARGDSLLVDGLEDFELPVRPEWAAAQHPELGVRLVDGGSAFARDGDHMAFLQRGIPSLHVHVGEYDRVAAEMPDMSESVDVRREAQLLCLIYYMVQDIANATQVPRWTPASRERQAIYRGR